MSTEDAPTVEGPIYRFDLTVEGLIYRFVNDDGFDRYDAAVAAYYGSRVPDPQEARWRADYSRAYLRWEKYEDRRGYSDADPLREQAQAIEQRWGTDPAVASRWAELDDLRAHFDYSTAYPPPDESTMPGEAPPGMDPVTWRSQLQARDMTGHARWPDTTTTTNREGAEPMTDPTRAERAEELHETESDTEQQMRADFMDAWSYAVRMTEEYDPADQLAYGEYANPWITGDDRWAHEWLYLEDATTRWDKDPAAAESVMRQRADVLSPIERRSEEQARYIAENGFEFDKHGLLICHYVTRLEERADAATESPAPLADYRPGNALAASMANIERDGVER
ncbi:hypothetical protein AB0H00_17865 [Nocardia sp. NPDC023852]|uniref:hypothetical protein n=1 Tax=Nocardia sp. NPDC023852 TaxID=3154697 RepID=UPI0033EFB52E